MRSAKGVADTLDDGQELDSELDSEPAEDSGTVQHGTTRAGDGSQAKAEAAADSEPPPPPPPKWARSCGGSGCPPGGWEYYFTGRGYVTAYIVTAYISTVCIFHASMLLISSSLLAAALRLRPLPSVPSRSLSASSLCVDNVVNI